MKTGHIAAAAMLLSLMISFQYVSGQEAVLVRKGQEDIIVNPSVYVFTDKSARIHDIDRVIAAPETAFRKNSSFQEVNYGFSQPYAWCRFAITNTSDDADWIIKVHQARVDTVQLYVQRQDGSIVKYPLTGHFQKIKDRPYHSLNFAHPVSIAKDETIVCYLFTMRKFARHAAILSVQTQEYYNNYNTSFIIFISALIGVCVLSAVIGVVMFVVLYERVHISYSVYCLCFLLLITVDSGFLYAFVNSQDNQKLINNLSVVFKYLVVGWHLLFTIELLKLKKYRPRWVYWLGIGSGILFCAVGVILLLPIPDEMRRTISWWSYYILFFLDVYILYAMIVQLIKKEVAVFFYMGGFLFTLVAASVTMLADLQILEGVNHRTDFFFIAPVVEIVCMVIGLGINSNRYVKERLQAQRQIITVQEDERERIGRDLHDDVGNSLAAVKNMLIHRRDPVLIEKEIDDIIQDVRNISHDLMPVDFSEYALADIVRHIVNKFKGQPGICFEYGQTGTARKLHPVVELVVYRIINELIMNCIKHSCATDVMIQLIYQKDSLVVMVEDNGKGIKNESEAGKGIGLKNIRHRVAYIGASLTMESDHKGTLFIIEVPYERKR